MRTSENGITVKDLPCTLAAVAGSPLRAHAAAWQPVGNALTGIRGPAATGC